jgi:hypothetical protein
MSPSPSSIREDHRRTGVGRISIDRALRDPHLLGAALGDIRNVGPVGRSSARRLRPRHRHESRGAAGLRRSSRRPGAPD